MMSLKFDELLKFDCQIELHRSIWVHPIQQAKLTTRAIHNLHKYYRVSYKSKTSNLKWKLLKQNLWSCYYNVCKFQNRAVNICYNGFIGFKAHIHMYIHTRVLLLDLITFYYKPSYMVWYSYIHMCITC